MASLSAQMLIVVGVNLAPRAVAGLAGRGWQASVVDRVPHAGSGATAFLVDSAETVREVRQHYPTTPIILNCAGGAVSAALDGIRAGANDVVSDPVTASSLADLLESAARPDLNDLRPVGFDLSVSLGFEQITGSAPPFLATLASAAKCARNRAAVLIQGEPGTGKAMIARAIHNSSSRRDRPFIEVDARLTPANEIESVLFGHEKGAFPGAFTKSRGKIREADGGTLLIRNPDYVPPHIQDQLAYVLKTGEVKPMGARGFREVDVRIVAATSGALTGEFFEMLAATRIFVPPLRARRSDIAALACDLLARVASFPGTRVAGITDAALTLLSSSDWPGNVTQLQGAIFRAVARCDGNRIDASDFPHIAPLAAPVHPNSNGRLNGSAVTLYQPDGHLRSLEEIEADVIRLAIGHYRGRMTEVARRLRIGRSTLYRKLEDLGISDAA